MLSRNLSDIFLTVHLAPKKKGKKRKENNCLLVGKLAVVSLNIFLCENNKNADSKQIYDLVNSNYIKYNKQFQNCLLLNFIIYFSADLLFHVKGNERNLNNNRRN